MEREALVNGYQSAYADSLGITDEDIQAYYEENASTLDTYDYRYIYLSGTAASTTDEDGNTVEPTEEETKAAMEAAKAKADAFVAAVNSSDDKETAFAELAPDYVSEDDKEDYEADPDASLHTGTDVYKRQAIGGVGAEARLPARQGDHRVAHGLDGHGAQGAGDLLTGGQQHIHLPLGGVGVDLRGLGNQIIRGVALGGEDRHDPVAPAVGLGYDAGHVADAVGIRDGAAAEFLNDESHWYMYPLNQEYPSVAEEARSSATFYALSPAPGTWSRASYPLSLIHI